MAKTARSEAPARGRRADAETWREARLARSRHGIVYDVHGPRVRLGVLWFVAILATLVVSTVAAAVLLAGVAALAGAQTARALRTRRLHPAPTLAAAIAGAIPLAAVLGAGAAGAAVLGSVVVAAAAAIRSPGSLPPVVTAGALVRAGVFAGVGAASIVLLALIDVGAAITLVVLVSAYETGDFLVGSGAANVVEGPVAGLVALAVVGGWVVLLQPPPFEGAEALLMVVLVAGFAPVGQLVASAILPRAGAPAPALRRLDSYLVTGPVWLVVLWWGLGA